MIKRLLVKLERRIKLSNLRTIRKYRSMKINPGLMGEVELHETKSGIYFKRIIRD